MKYEGDIYYNLGGYFELYNSLRERMSCFFAICLHLYRPAQLFFFSSELCSIQGRAESGLVLQNKELT